MFALVFMTHQSSLNPTPFPFLQAADITDIYTYHNTTKNLGSFCRGPKTEKNKIE